MNKVIFITGATSGFGKATALKFAKNGYDVILLGRREERLKKLKDDILKMGVKAHTICADVRDKEAVFKAIDNLPDEFRKIEILVNNAGLALGQDKFGDAKMDDLETMVDTNIKGVLYITKAVLPLINKGGYIFNIGSVAGNWSYQGSNVYGGTKAFIKQFSLNLRNDIRGSGIRVTNIEPGLCKTEFSLVRFKGDKQKADKVYENTQFITADNIAEIIYSCAILPKNVNINSLEVMTTNQTWAGFFHERVN